MSSNISIQKICQHCGKDFTAKTTVTQYCSPECSKRAYKVRQRAAKIQASNDITKAFKAKPIEQLKEREFLTVTQVSKLIGCSRQNIYKMINSGKLKATNILEKKTIIKRSDIDNLFEHPKTNNEAIEIKPSAVSQIELSDCYTISEIQKKFGISEKALQELIKRNEIPKIKLGSFAYVPKFKIDNIFKTTSSNGN